MQQKQKHGDEEYKKGVELVLKQFRDVLASKGVEEIKTVGETFDPELYEAVSSIQDDNLGEKERRIGLSCGPLKTHDCPALAGQL